MDDSLIKQTNLYEGLEQPLSEGPEWTSIFRGFVLGLGLF